MTRLSKDEYFLKVADLLKERSTCPRRQVGCVLVDEHHNVIATGYNGNARNTDHCIDVPCPGVVNPETGKRYESGQGLDKCEAIHAEQNALLQCSDVMRIFKAYTTTKPCIHCMKLLMNTSVKEIHYLQDYSSASAEHVNQLADKASIRFIHHHS